MAESTADALPSTADPFIGQTLVGKFRIERLLGVGAMGKVYLAEHLSLARPVAVKVLHKHLMNDEALAKRFHREARSASTLNHPNSIQIMDFGQSEDGALFIAMELLEGRDLSKIIRTEFPLAPVRTVHIVAQVLAALDVAHAKGIIHRDLKPENIMVVDLRGEKDFVKVCDFGIAKVQDPKADGETAAITMAGLVCGTPEYMSPEQARGDKLDGRSDLYSVGVILYQMVTGDVPFKAESALGIVTKHLVEAPVPPRVRRPDLDIPPALEALLLRAMSKERDGRPVDAVAFREELLAIGDQLPRPSATGGSRPRLSVTPSTGLPVSGTAATALGTPVPVGTPSQAALPGSRGRSVALWATLAVLLLGGSAAAFYLVPRRPTQSSPASPAAAGAPPGIPAPHTPAPVAISPAPPPAAIAPVVAPAAVLASKRTPATATERHRDADDVRRGGRTSSRPGSGQPGATPATPAVVAAVPVPAAKPRTYMDAYDEGLKAYDAGDPNGAIDKLKEAARLNPGYADTYKLLGRSYNKLGDPGTANEYFRKYLALAPNAPDRDYIRGIIGN